MSDMNISLQTGDTFYDRMHRDYLEQRKIIINDDINNFLVESAILQIIRWNEIDDQNNTPLENRQVITIYVNTPGGDIGIGFVLCNVIEHSKTPIKIITLGQASSMGAYIAMSGHKGLRYCYPFTTYLIHSGSMVVSGNANDVTSTVKYYTDMKDDIASFIYKHTKITPKLYKAQQKEEWLINAKLGKKLSLVDHIIGVDC
jgi:ATP-dependent Clp protease protease subunit